VLLPKGPGQGVVIAGGYVLTAAHCIEWDARGGIVLGDFLVEPIRIGDEEVRGTPIVIEACSDIAVLSIEDLELRDPVAFERDAETWKARLATVKPVPLFVDDIEERKPFAVHIRSHKGEWIDGRATLWREGSHVVCVKAARQVEGGSSGGPIVTDAGELLGVVSNCSIGDDCTGMVYRPHLSLPGWLLWTIGAAPVTVR
jgi:hypothetical protein